MTGLPAVDVGLMAEHLSVHEGVINKLLLYETMVTNVALRETLKLQANVMRSHVKVMLALMNPYQNGYVGLPYLNEYIIHFHPQVEEGKKGNKNNKWIALESQYTAQTMAGENFSSALMMKDPNVGNIHAEMAIQQFTLQRKYESLINKMGWTFVPHVTMQEQVNTYHHYEYMIKQ